MRIYIYIYIQISKLYNIKHKIAYIIYIFFLPVQSSQTIILHQLFNELSKTDNLKDADLLEKKIWAVWNKHPENIILTDKLEFGTELMYKGNYNYALKVFNNINVRKLLDVQSSL